MNAETLAAQESGQSLPRQGKKGTSSQEVNGSPRASAKLTRNGDPRRHTGRAILSHFFAAMVGAGAVIGAGYLVITGYVPDVSLADPEMQRQIALLQNRVIELDRGLRIQANTTVSPADASLPFPEDRNELRARLDSAVLGARGMNDALQALSQRVQTLETRQAPAFDPGIVQAEAARQIAPLAARLSNMERELDSISKAQSERQMDARSAALTLALTNLKRAVSDGRPFGQELAAVDNLSATKLPVSQLAPFKDKGVATLLELEREFAAASKRALDKVYRSDGGTVMAEVLSRAKAAIQIRPAGAEAGDSVEATLSRMEAGLKSGDLRGALAQSEGLKSPALDEMRGWLARAQGRISAEDALTKTDQDLLATLTRTSSRRQ